MRLQCVVMRGGRFWTGDKWSDEYADAELMGIRAAKNTASILDAKAIEGYGNSDIVLVNFEAEEVAK